MYFNITSAHYLEGYKVALTFQDNSKGEVDLTEYANKGTVFKKFLDISFFKAFKIDYGTLTWDNSMIDIAPETLYIKATGKEIVWKNAS